MNDSLVTEFRQRHGLDEDFDREIIRVFKDNVLEQYRIAFEEYLRKTNLDWDHLRVVLGIHRGTVSRWIKGEIRPELDTIYLYIAARDIPLTNVGFPGGRKAVLRGLARTLEVINSRFAEGPRTSLDDQQVQCVRFVMSHPRLGSVGGNKQGDSVLLAIAEELNAVMPQRCSLDVHALRRFIGDWFIPWVLLTDALPYDWVHYRYESQA